MILTKNENNYCKTAKLSQDNLDFFIEKFYNDYFRIETKPYSKKTSLFLKSGQNNIETEVFEAFKELILSLNEAYKKYPYTGDRIVVDTEECFIAIKSDSVNPNILKIDYTPSFTDITITIYQNPKHGYSNNCIIIDKDGILFENFFYLLSELLDRLFNFEPQKKNKVLQLIGNFSNRKSCN